MSTRLIRITNNHFKIDIYKSNYSRSLKIPENLTFPCFQQDIMFTLVSFLNHSIYKSLNNAVQTIYKFWVSPKA